MKFYLEKSREPMLPASSGIYAYYLKADFELRGETYMYLPNLLAIIAETSDVAAIEEAKKFLTQDLDIQIRKPE